MLTRSELRAIMYRLDGYVSSNDWAEAHDLIRDTTRRLEDEDYEKSFFGRSTADSGKRD